MPGVIESSDEELDTEPEMEKLKLILRRSPQKEGVFFCSSSNGGDLNTSSSVTTKAGQSSALDSLGTDGVDVGNSNLLPDIRIPLCDPLDHGPMQSSAVVSRKRKASLVADVSMLSDQVSAQNRESKRRGTETRSSKSRRRFDSPPNKPPDVPWNMRSRDNKDVLDDDDDSSPLTLHKDEIMLEMTTTVARVRVQRLSQRRYRRSIAALQSTSAISGSATQSSSVAASDESENPSVRPSSRASAGGGDTGRVVKTNSTALRRQNPNRCSYCPFVSMDRIEVKEHVRTEHQIKCMKCWMTFESREERQEHMLTNHSEFGFYCEDCNMIFRQREFLNDHLATLKHKALESLHLRILAELVKTHNLPIALPPQIMDHPFRGELANIHSCTALTIIRGTIKPEHIEAAVTTAPPLKRARRDTVKRFAANSSQPNNAKLPSEQQGPSLSMMQQPLSSTQQRDAGSFGWDEVAAYIPNCEADNSSGAAESGKVGAVKQIYDYLTCDAPEANGVSSMASANAPSVVSFNQFASYPPPTESSMQTSEFANAGAASGNMSMDHWNGYCVPHHHSYNNSFVYYPQQTPYWSNSMHSTDQHYAFQQYPSSQFQSSNSSSFQPEQQYCGMGPFSTRSYSIQGNGDGYGEAEFPYANSSHVNFNPSNYQMPISNTAIEPLAMLPTETFGGGSVNDAIAESTTVSQDALIDVANSGAMPIEMESLECSDLPPQLEREDLVDINGGRTTCDSMPNAGGVASETHAIAGNEIGDAGSSRENTSVAVAMFQSIKRERMDTIDSFYDCFAYNTY